MYSNHVRASMRDASVEYAHTRICTHFDDRRRRDRVPAAAGEERTGAQEPLLRGHALPAPHDRGRRGVLGREPVAELRWHVHDRGVKAREPPSCERLSAALARRAVVGRAGAAPTLAIATAALSCSRLESSLRVALLQSLVSSARAAVVRNVSTARVVAVRMVLLVMARERLRAHRDVLEKVERSDVARDFARVRVRVARALAVDARRRVAL